MHKLLIIAAIIACTPFGAALAAIKKIPYPEVKVEIADVYVPDSEFQAMINKFTDAVRTKNFTALFELVGPTFTWTSNWALQDEFEHGRDSLHNFKVVFGFRTAGKNQDGGVAEGPYWEALASFLADLTFYKASDSTNLVCGPLAAEAVNSEILEQAQAKLTIGEDSGSWYFTVGTNVYKSPADTATSIAKLGKVAVPVLSTLPLSEPGQQELPPTHLEILLPNGKTGWILASAAHPLTSDRLCYAKTSDGSWKIVSYDEN